MVAVGPFGKGAQTLAHHSCCPFDWSNLSQKHDVGAIAPNGDLRRDSEVARRHELTDVMRNVTRSRSSPKDIQNRDRRVVRDALLRSRIESTLGRIVREVDPDARRAGKG